MFNLKNPRTGQSHFQVALLALEVGQLALVALRDTTAALDLQEDRIAPLVRPKASIEPVAPETPKLLPAVHMFWGTLAASLKASAAYNACSSQTCAESILAVILTAVGLPLFTPCNA